MSDEHEQGHGTNPGGGLEEVAAGGHGDRAEQWQRDDGVASVHEDAQQDTAGQWAGDDDASGEQDTPAQWYEEGEGRDGADGGDGDGAGDAR